MIPLVKDTISNEEIDSLIEWLKTYPHLTKGNLTLEYEKEWSNYLGTKYSVFVNSGSSANLMMLYSLIASGKIKKGDKVVVPAVSWSTDLAPVVQLGLTPVLCDCNLDNLSIDVEHFKK
jgi:CDP-6-deoxy-D-xylo-4-hexulose-3-dehydrase